MFRNPIELRDDQKSENTPDPFGRLGVDDDEPDTEIADIKAPSTLTSSVGDNGQNSRRDVAKTEQLLGQAGTLDLKKTDGPTGYWGTRTSDATKTFQKKNGLKVDGEINPGGETIRALGELASQVVRAVTKNSQNKAVIPAKARTQSKVTTSWVPDQVRDGKDAGRSGLSDDAFSENHRAARYLASRDGIGEFSKFVADGIETDGDKAIAETVDLYRQTAEMNQNQADALINKVMPGLSPENAKRLKSAIMPMQDDPQQNSLEPDNLSLILENVRQKRDAESALFNRLQGDVGEKDNQQQKRSPSLDERTEDSFGFKAGVERPQGILPMPDKKDGAWHEPGDRDWTSWTAPEWVHEGVKAVALPKHILDGGAWSEQDATKAALAIGAGGAAGKSSPGSLHSGFTRLRGTPKFMRNVDLEKQGQQAAKKVMDENVSVPQALFREDFGEITFDYGSDGKGLQHIRSQRIAKDNMSKDQATAFILKKVPEVLANGRLSQIVGPPNGRRAVIKHDGASVILSIRREGTQETWVVTGYEDW